MLRETRFNKDVKKVLDYIMGKITNLDPHFKEVFECTCVNCKEHKEICELIESLCWGDD